jgi:nitrogen fixation protein
LNYNNLYQKLINQYGKNIKIKSNAISTQKKTKRGYLQGTFIPKNKNKFIIVKNKQNGGKIKYRSSWELKFLQWCDQNPNIIKVISEGIKIPYKDVDGKIKNYYPDFVILYKNDKLLIEIKPENQTLNETNQRKFAAAKEFANQKGLKFLILTEKELQNLIK